MMIFKYSFLISLSLIIFVKSYQISFINFLKDFLQVQNSPKNLHLFICWEIGLKKNLIKTLNEYSSISIKGINSSIETNQILNQQTTFLLDSNCIGFENLLEKAQTMNLFSSPFRWIFIGNKEDVSTNLDILIDSKFYVITQLFNNETLNNHSIEITSIYKTSKTSHKYLENHLGIWKEKFLYFNDINLIQQRYNLYGLTLNVSYVITNLDSLNHLWDYRDKHIDTISKLNYILSHTVLHTMNASGNFLITNTWGYKNQTTGIYSGMVGDLQAKRAELGGTAVFFTADRLQVMEYIAPTTPTRAVFMFRAPPLSYVHNVLTLPFSKEVWLASSLLVVLICILIYVIAKWEWNDKEFRKTLEGKHNVLEADFMECVVLGLGAICQQGSEAEPRSASGRIAAFIVFLILMFLYTSYSANIVALLQSTSDSINTIEDLLTSRIQLGVELTPYSKYYFETATDEVRKAIYQQKIAPKGTMSNFMDIQTGIKKMREEFFAFHVEASNGYKVVSETFQENEKCGLKGIEILQVIDPWVAVAKDTSYKELFKFGFRKLHESGVQNREFRKLYVRKPVCQIADSNFTSVGLIDCYYAFLIFGIGTAMSLILLIFEKILYMKRQRIILMLKRTKIYDCKETPTEEID